MYLIWAFRTTDDVMNDGSFQQHSQRGSMKVVMDFTTPDIPTEKSGSTAMYVPSLFGVLAVLFLNYVIGA